MIISDVTKERRFQAKLNRVQTMDARVGQAGGNVHDGKNILAGTLSHAPCYGIDGRHARRPRGARGRARHEAFTGAFSRQQDARLDHRWDHVMQLAHALMTPREPGPIHLVRATSSCPAAIGWRSARGPKNPHPAALVLFMARSIDQAPLRDGTLLTGAGFIQGPLSSEALARKMRTMPDDGAGNE